jgi:hypothetical protein
MSIQVSPSNGSGGAPAVRFAGTVLSLGWACSYDASPWP